MMRKESRGLHFTRITRSYSRIPVHRSFPPAIIHKQIKSLGQRRIRFGIVLVCPRMTKRSLKHSPACGENASTPDAAVALRFPPHPSANVNAAHT